MRARVRPRPRAAAGKAARSRRGSRRRGASAGNAAKRAQLAPRAGARHEHAVGCVLALDRSARRVRTAPSSFAALVVRHEQATRSQRFANRSAIRPQLLEPLARRARNLHASGNRLAAGRPSSSTASILLITSSTGSSSAPISASTRSTGRDLLVDPLLGGRSSATWSTRSATSVSSSVAANPSTSWCGSRRMKPTVSVTR